MTNGTTHIFVYITNEANLNSTVDSFMDTVIAQYQITTELMKEQSSKLRRTNNKRIKIIHERVNSHKYNRYGDHLFILLSLVPRVST